MNPYETLGLARTATADEVKQAYRRRASETHPDKGGNADEFRRVQDAYEVLSDPARRRKYDVTGDDGRSDVPAAHLIATRAFLDAIHDPKIEGSGRNFLQHAVLILRRKAKETAANLGNCEHNLKAYRETRRHLTHKKGQSLRQPSDDPLGAALDDQIAITAAAQAELAVWITRIREAEQCIETYRFADPSILFALTATASTATAS